MPRESRIRDQLASRLDLLETDLTLVDTEFHLPNQHGSFGFVDLVARDRFGNIVLVELKQDDAPARQAIHELYKYVALVRQNHAIPAARIRCMVVSTTWHELLTPFSDFERTVPYLVEGFEITIDSDGVPLSVNRVDSIAEPDEVAICPFQQLVFCVSRTVRSEAANAIINGFREVNLGSVLLIEFDHDENIYHPFPFALCLVMGKLDGQTRSRVIEDDILGAADLAKELAEYEDYEGWHVEAALVGQHFVLLEEIRNSPTQSYNTEICYPEKLRGILADKWRFASLVRFGALFASDDIYPDPEVIKWCTGAEGGNPAYYSALTSPRFSQQWERIPKALDFVLGQESYTSLGIKSFLTRLEQESQSCSVGISVFCPFDFLSHLAMTLHSGQARYMPSIDVFAYDEKTGRAHLLEGFVSWSDTPVSVPASELITQVFGGFEEYAIKRHFHETSPDEAEILAALHGRWQLVQGGRFGNRDTQPTVFSADDDWQPLGNAPLLLEHFVDLNAEWCLGFLELMRPLVAPR